MFKGFNRVRVLDIVVGVSIALIISLITLTFTGLGNLFFPDNRIGDIHAALKIDADWPNIRPVDIYRDKSGCHVAYDPVLSLDNLLTHNLVIDKMEFMIPAEGSRYPFVNLLGGIPHIIFFPNGTEQDIPRRLPLILKPGERTLVSLFIKMKGYRHDLQTEALSASDLCRIDDPKAFFGEVFAGVAPHKGLPLAIRMTANGSRVVYILDTGILWVGQKIVVPPIEELGLIPGKQADQK